MGHFRGKKWINRGGTKSLHYVTKLVFLKLFIIINIVA